MNNIETVVVAIDKIVPYWRNPRNNKVAIEKVKESIEKYGYQSPIVVDKEMTIIAGHTRYQALKQLGYTEIPVVVSSMSQKKAKEFRIIDNKTSEYSTWTDDLLLELKEFTDKNVIDTFFPNIKLETNFGDFATPYSDQDIEQAKEKLENSIQGIYDSGAAEPKIVIPCPYCHETITLLKKDLDKPKNWSE